MTDADHRDLCFLCRGFKDIAYTEEDTGRTFCLDCAMTLPPTSEELAMILLTDPRSPFSVPYRPGDRVEARLAGQFLDGVGVVEEISMDLKDGGTAVYPTFRVRLEEKVRKEAPDEMWYTEICLTRVS